MKILGTILALLLSSPSSALDPQRVELKVGVRCESPIALTLVVTNRTSQHLQIEESDLPWNNSSDVKMEAFLVSDGKATPLQRVSPISDHLRKLKLAPNQSLSGEIALNRAFADFDAANKTATILVLYRINEMTVESRIRYFGSPGAVIVPRRGIFATECPALVSPVLDSQ